MMGSRDRGQGTGDRGQGGFTLLELLMVVIIIGILASVAMPQYLKTREKARMAEAMAILGQVRSSQVRYYAERNTYTAVITQLDFNPMTDVAGTRAYDYTIGSADADNFVAVATRNGNFGGAGPGCTPSYTIRINRNGDRCGTDCQTIVLTC